MCDQTYTTLILTRKVSLVLSPWTAGGEGRALDSLSVHVCNYAPGSKGHV
ncbi:hypothetical protein GBAR_LOCUS20384 [Geodia barretti]|uniref:Uncharacterized protein n=1 Tax=Geodia barretti TaxID=519541 RepID=A0AA35X3E8_GEOBA|nr:hypothetical protein GBAR_LOCUS20384 [Geodia barretti]